MFLVCFFGFFFSFLLGERFVSNFLMIALEMLTTCKTITQSITRHFVKLLSYHIAVSQSLLRYFIEVHRKGKRPCVETGVKRGFMIHEPIYIYLSFHLQGKRQTANFVTKRQPAKVTVPWKQWGLQMEGHFLLHYLNELWFF